MKAGVMPADHLPVVSSQLNPDKSFSFIEFSTIDEATAGTLTSTHVLICQECCHATHPREGFPLSQAWH